MVERGLTAGQTVLLNTQFHDALVLGFILQILLYFTQGAHGLTPAQPLTMRFRNTQRDADEISTQIESQQNYISLQIYYIENTMPLFDAQEI